MNTRDPFDAFRGSSLDRIPEYLEKYMGPYNQAGMNALPGLQDQYGKLLNNPGDFMNKMGANYQQSPGFKFALEQAMQGGNNAAASGGMAGSPMHQQQNMQMATNLANQDYNNWIQRAMGLYGRGLSGQENLYNVGAHAGQGMGEDLSQYLMSKEMMKYANNANNDQFWNGLIGAGVGLAGKLAFL